MQKSTNYELNLPERNDQYNIEHWNENTEKIDAALHENAVNIGKNANDISALQNSLGGHADRKDNPHGVTKAQVGLGNCNNTADANKAVASARKLTTARKVYVKLGTASTTETKDFSGDTAIPVSGTLPVANGGTGKTSLDDVSVGYATKAGSATNAGSATTATYATNAKKLTTARIVYVKLGTASTTETKDFSDDTAIPVSGTLPVANGGTGKTSLDDVSVGYATKAGSATNATNATNAANASFATEAANAEKVGGYSVSTAAGNSFVSAYSKLDALVPVERQYFGDTSGYIKYANGLIIQWGYIDKTANTNTLISLPISYTSPDSYTIFQAYGKADNTEDVFNYPLCTFARTENSFTIRSKSDVTGSRQNYLTVGY